MPHMVDMERIAADCKKKHGYGAPAALMGSLATGGSPFHTRVARLLVDDDNLDKGWVASRHPQHRADALQRVRDHEMRSPAIFDDNFDVGAHDTHM